MEIKIDNQYHGQYHIAGNLAAVLPDSFECNLGGGIPLESTRFTRNKRLTLIDELNEMVKDLGLPVDEVLIKIERQPEKPEMFYLSHAKSRNSSSED